MDCAGPGTGAAAATLATLWLAGRVRSPERAAAVSAESLSLAAAAEASVDAGEPLIAMMQADDPSAERQAS